MMNIGKLESAAEIFESVNLFEKAIDCFLRLKKFDRAMECAHNVRPNELQEVLTSKIQAAKKDMYIADNKITKLVESGDMSGLEMLASRGQWDECLQLAARQGEEFLHKYLMMFAKPYLHQGKFKETARTLAKYNSPYIQQMLPVYKTIAIEVLAGVNDVELQILKEMLQKLIHNLTQKLDKNNQIVYLEFMKFLTATHLLLLKTECQKARLDRVVAKQCSSLLRYTKEIRCDKAFLDAGESNRKIGNNDMAFIFFNRYIDLYDAIEDPDNNTIQENGEFENTDIPSPYEISLPEKNLLSAAERDRIRDWVLEINMDGNVGNSLPVRTCEYCQYDELYEASLSCPQCKSQWEPCIVSGYPCIKS